jgi:hypothetical protein
VTYLPRSAGGSIAALAVTVLSDSGEGQGREEQNIDDKRDFRTPKKASLNK